MVYISKSDSVKIWKNSNMKRDRFTLNRNIWKQNNDVYVDSNATKISIAIGMGITSKGTAWNTTYNKIKAVGSIQFFTNLLPSFCKTASSGYNYNFFLAYDIDDGFYNSKEIHIIFHHNFISFVNEKCPKYSRYSLHFIQCSHKGTPARAQNDAMMEAYMSNMQYYYRINDDTVMKTAGWTKKFINTLKTLDPPFVGVVGPRHFQGNTKILTYDFVHYTHLHIHGFYYPRVFTDWFADGWITYSYQPNRVIKLNNVFLDHTLQLGTRYQRNETIKKWRVQTWKLGLNSVNR